MSQIRQVAVAGRAREEEVLGAGAGVLPGGEPGAENGGYVGGRRHPLDLAVEVLVLLEGTVVRRMRCGAFKSGGEASVLQCPCTN